MLKVVSFKICPFVQRVTGLLEAKKIPYEIEYIEINNKPEWFLNISPTAQVPVLVTESGIPLFESDAIIEYLDEVYPPLRPELTPEARAHERAWSYQGSKHYLVQCSTMRSADRASLETRQEKLTKMFGRVEKELGAGPYFGGEQLGNVDIAWLPLLHRAQIVKEHAGHDFLVGFPKAQAWQKQVLSTGLGESSVPEDFREKFGNFYLSNKTYLGKGGERKAAGGGCGTPPAKAGCCGLDFLRLPPLGGEVSAAGFFFSHKHHTYTCAPGYPGISL